METVLERFPALKQRMNSKGREQNAEMALQLADRENNRVRPDRKNTGDGARAKRNDSNRGVSVEMFYILPTVNK